MVQLNDMQKHEIVFRHTINKQSIRKISLDMKINRITVNKWLKKYNNDDNFNRKNGSGRKKRLSTLSKLQT